MRIDWKCYIVVLIVVLTVVGMASLSAFAADGRGSMAGQGGSQGAAGGVQPATGGGVHTGGGAGTTGGISHEGARHTGGAGQVTIGAREGGARTGGHVGTSTGRSFNRNEFFGGQGHDQWRRSHEHHFWNGNAWVFGVEPVGFVPVAVPVSSCPFNPGMYGGDPNTCFFSCVDSAYDPVSVCDVCCGTNY